MRANIARGAVLWLIVGSAVATPAAATVRAYDFDADGRSELVIGLPEQPLPGRSDGGALAILRGTPSGLSLSADVITPATPGAAVPADSAYAFGEAVASADFDGDGFADLAVADSSAFSTETEEKEVTLGAVSVYFGSATGLQSARATAIRGPEFDVEFSASEFGSALVAGDLNADGFGDLVVGAPGDDPIDDGDGGNGSVRMLFGSSSGLSEAGSRRLRPRRIGEGMWSGTVLGIGDFNRDGNADLLSAEPGNSENSDLDGRPGHVAYCRGTPSGPQRCDTLPALGRDGLGPTSIAVGDVTGDGYDDAMLGMPFDRYESEDEAPPKGAVVVLRGSRRGLRRAPIVITQELGGIPGRSHVGDRFGTAVAVMRIDADRYADLLVSAPGEDRGTGRVTIIRGGRSGSARRGHQVLDPARLGVPAPRGRAFGSAMTLADHDGDGRQDLSISAPGRRGTASLLSGVIGGFDRSTARTFGMADLGLAGRFVPVFGRTDGSCCVTEGGAY